mmetsp:Transcript_22021/g.24480  ORF Transcript_22021/g.24480 Transcript_22021/m.24480 type:complete len:377 (+) Transcript_22021:108-1238(+)
MAVGDLLLVQQPSILGVMTGPTWSRVGLVAGAHVSGSSGRGVAVVEMTLNGLRQTPLKSWVNSQPQSLYVRKLICPRTDKQLEALDKFLEETDVWDNRPAHEGDDEEDDGEGDDAEDEEEEEEDGDTEQDGDTERDVSSFRFVLEAYQAMGVLEETDLPVPGCFSPRFQLPMCEGCELHEHAKLRRHKPKPSSECSHERDKRTSQAVTIPGTDGPRRARSNCSGSTISPFARAKVSVDMPPLQLSPSVTSLVCSSPNAPYSPLRTVMGRGFIAPELVWAERGTGQRKESKQEEKEESAEDHAELEGEEGHEEGQQGTPRSQARTSRHAAHDSKSVELSEPFYFFETSEGVDPQGGPESGSFAFGSCPPEPIFFLSD